jgi:3-hydroxybutyryl-CoA dehydrogenase
MAVIGAGVMGSQIALLLAKAGYQVSLYSRTQATLDKALQTMKAKLPTLLGKPADAPELAQIIGRIAVTTSVPRAVAGAQIVIESVDENLELKRNLFKQLDENTGAETILISNTSQLNITEIASATQRPDKVIGIHFFQPVGTSKLVEVVRGTFTSDTTLNTAIALAQKLGKETAVCKDFSFGFLANRAYTAMILEAVQMVWERVAPPVDIDKALKLSHGLPIGPLELGDYVGVWRILAMSENEKIKAMGAEKGQLHPLIRMMTRAGYNGGKGAKGIYAFYKEVMQI